MTNPLSVLAGFGVGQFLLPLPEGFLGAAAAPIAGDGRPFGVDAALLADVWAQVVHDGLGFAVVASEVRKLAESALQALYTAQQLHASQNDYAAAFLTNVKKINKSFSYTTSSAEELLLYKFTNR